MKWKTVRLGNIAQEDRRMVSANSEEAAIRPYLGLEDIESGTGRIIASDSGVAEGKSTTFAFGRAHVLYGKLRPYLNKVAVPEHEGRCSTEIIPLLPCGVDRELLAFALRTDAIVDLAMSEKTGSRMPRADMDVLFDAKIEIPETEAQQRRIAARLKAQLAEVDTARQAAQAQVRDAGLLRNRLLQQSLRTLEDAPRKVLGEYARTTSGVTPSRSNAAYWQPPEVPWVKTGEINFAPITAAQEFVSRKALAECSLSLLPPGTVLLAITGEGKTRGRSAVLEIAATTNQHSVAIFPNDTWDADFLQLWLQSAYEDLRELSEGRGGSRSALSGGQVKALKVPAPDIDEQRRIVTGLKARLAQADALAGAAATRLAEIQRLPQRILAKAFSPSP